MPIKSTSGQGGRRGGGSSPGSVNPNVSRPGYTSSGRRQEFNASRSGTGKMPPPAAPLKPKPTPPPPPGGGGTGKNATPPAKPAANPNKPAEKSEPKAAPLRYPLGTWDTKQDFIMFTVLKYGKKEFKEGERIGFEPRKNLPPDPAQPTITLPIQGKITDQNLVNWSNSQELNALQIAAAGLSEGVMKGDDQAVAAANDAAVKAKFAARDADVRRSVNLYLAGKASSTTGLLSRIEGAIANPNLELLFQGPELRQFSFTFLMSARSEPEATAIRKIIRVFKQNMAPNTTKTNIFLKSPNIFKVEYRTPSGLHPSINRIKECALTNLQVDYTPAGTYSTYNDAKRTMTAYSMTLQFQELEPIFADEYKNVNLDEIGF